MLFDSDVLIWALRGNTKAAAAIAAAESRALSIVSYMELLQGARDKREVKAINSFLADLQFNMVPLSENVGHRASIYMEEYGRAVALSTIDALLAATAIEAGLPLATGNDRHYSPIRELTIKRFRP